MSDRIVVTDPATEEVLAEVASAGKAEVAAAVHRAGAAWAEWRWLSANERAALLHEAATLDGAAHQ